MPYTYTLALQGIYTSEVIYNYMGFLLREYLCGRIHISHPNSHKGYYMPITCKHHYVILRTWSWVPTGIHGDSQTCHLNIVKYVIYLNLLSITSWYEESLLLNKYNLSSWMATHPTTWVILPWSYLLLLSFVMRNQEWCSNQRPITKR